MQNEWDIIDCSNKGIMMNFNLDSLTYGTVIFQPLVPAPFKKWVIPGSLSHYAEGAFGNILFQEINAGGITLFYNISSIRKDLALDIIMDQPVWLIHITMKNENRYDINGMGTVYLEQGRFNMIRSSCMEGTSYLEHNNEYRTFSMYYPGEKLKELLPFFPFLYDFINGANSPKPALLFKNHRRVNTQIMDAINRLLNCPYRGSSMRQLYFDYKIKELLLLLFTGEDPGTITRDELNKHTIDSIKEAKHIIEMNSGEHITLQSIARQVGMDETKLAAGFRLLFGIGIFEYLLEASMHKNMIAGN
jgi:AraC-like DNA-binding protein